MPEQPTIEQPQIEIQKKEMVEKFIKLAEKHQLRGLVLEKFNQLVDEFFKITKYRTFEQIRALRDIQTMRERSEKLKEIREILKNNPHFPKEFLRLLKIEI